MSKGGNIWVILAAVACWFVGMGLYSWYYSRKDRHKDK